jgi:folate-binding protein YgfZ
MSSIETLKALPEKFAVRLDNHMLITLEGEQADSYLQGQITVNVNKLTADHARHYAHCDNKGKTWSVGYVARFNSKIAMITNKASGAHSLAQLNKYGVFSKADIIDESNAHTLWFVSSNTVGDALSHFPSSVVAQEDIERLATASEPSEQGTSLESFANDSLLALQTGFKHGGVVLVLTEAVAEQVQANLNQHSVPQLEASTFDALQIDSVHPALSESAVAEYVPQMINVQALNGIDFDKGCYMGQEVVARTRFLGKNKRAAYSFTLPMHVDVKEGDSLEKQLGDNWRVAGKIISVATLGKETHFIAVLSNDTTPEDLHRLADQTNVTCYPNALPYNIEQKASNIVKKRR